MKLDNFIKIYIYSFKLLYHLFLVIAIDGYKFEWMLNIYFFCAIIFKDEDIN